MTGYSATLGLVKHVSNNVIFLVQTLAKSEKFFNDSKVYKESLELAKLFFEDKQGKVSANDATREITGTDILELMGATHLITETPDQDELLSAAELGRRLNLSTRKTNSLLEQAGFQARYRGDKGDLHWALTPLGRKYAIYFDIKKKHASGNPVKQIRWYGKVVGQLEIVK